uniref:Non-structural maintenance of chromosomes element 4 n=1 Tax=Suricata suricatta TaxID=37032 RepID=A0A673T3G7_SURSU
MEQACLSTSPPLGTRREAWSWGKKLVLERREALFNPALKRGWLSSQEEEHGRSGFGEDWSALTPDVGGLVSRAREAVLDAQFLVLASDLGKEKAKQLRSDLNSFDMLRYVETLLTHMGVNPLEAEELIRDEDSSDFEFIVYDSWKISGKTAENTINKTHTFHFLLGSIQGEFPVPKPRSDRPRKGPTTEEKKTMPDQLSEMEDSHQEATEKEVERILGLLQTYFQEDPDTPMSFFDFVVDPHSFPRTVENIFHVSFIIRDGFARIKLDQDRLPIIEPVNINEESEGIDQNTQIRNQGVIALSYRDWEEIVKTFEISEPVIASGQSQQRLSA